MAKIKIPYSKKMIEIKGRNAKVAVIPDGVAVIVK